jgi:lysophospholipase L1-like esterase
VQAAEKNHGRMRARRHLNATDARMQRARSRRKWVVVVMLLVVLVATGASPTSSATARGRNVTIIGDSLVENRGKWYIEAFSIRDVWSSADGFSGRTIRTGWLCRTAQGVRKVFPRPIHSRCGIEGLELLQRMVRRNELGSDLVLALGTNDARTFSAQRNVENLDAVRAAIGKRRMWLVSVVLLKDRARAERWNSMAAAWCARDIACSMVPWASLRRAWDPSLYVGDGVHLAERGTKLRAEMIATAVAGP